MKLRKKKNMNSGLISLGLISILFFSCQSNHDKIEISKQEIIVAEKDFAALCEKEGLEKAFTTFADTDAVIRQKDSVIRGKEEIRRHYSDPKFRTVSLKWSPDFVDVSACGDLGYTYGHFIFTTTDSTGRKTEHTGIFHTVWKKRDGKWKYVWDN